MPMSSRALFARLLSYSFAYWPAFGLAVLAMVVTAVAETAFPALMKPLVDQGFSGKTSFQIWWVPTAIMLVFVVRGLSGFLVTYMMQWVANNVLRDLRQAMFDRLVTMPTVTYDTKSSGQLISKIISEAQFVLNAATHVVTVLIRDSLILVGLLAWLFWINWKLTTIVIVLLPPLAFVTYRFSRRMRSVGRTYLSAISQMTGTVEETISGNRVIKVFGGQDYEKNRFTAVNAFFRGQAMRFATASALQSPVSQMIAAVGVATVVTIALLQARSGTSTIGDFVSFISAMLLMFPPLKHLADVNAELQRGLAAAENVFGLIDEPAEKDSGTVKLSNVKGIVSFKSVYLQYPSRDRPALNHISLEIPAGKTFAIVGPSGGGKSSLVNLLPRLYELTSGFIEIDGIDIRSVTLQSLRAQIALVSQDVVLFNDTIARNITYGRTDLLDDQLHAAIVAADLATFVDALPEKANTIVGDRGVRLSGGQRQRIGIARAIIKDAPILIFDEATSSLDTASEASVQAAIDRLRAGRTTLIVAHRLSTIVNADQIVVLEHGEIVQRGSHDQLISERGLYQNLYARLRDQETSFAKGSN